jgi:uncharacterized membrane protein YgcG
LIVGTLALLLFAPAQAHAAEPVIDEANIIPDAEEAVLNKVLIDFYKQSGRQVAVVTIKSLNGQEIQPVATERFRQLGVGSKELNDGVLFLVAPTDRKMRIEVGYGLEEYLTDAESGRIIDGVKPYFKKEEYGPGITYATSAIINNISPDAIAHAAAEKKKEEIANAKAAEAFGSFIGWVFTIIAGLGAAIGSIWLITLPGRKRREREEAEAYAARIKKQREERDVEYARLAKEQAERRAAEEAARKKREKAEREEKARKDREWAEYLKNETPAQKKERLAKEEADRVRKAEADRLAAIAAAEAAAIAEANRRARAEQDRKDREARAKREAEEEEERRRNRSSYDYGSSSSSGWGSSSSSSDWGSSSSSSSFDFGGGSSGGGGSDGSW